MTRVHCPRCHTTIEPQGGEDASVTCPGCGFTLEAQDPDETVTLERVPLRTVGHFELLERVGGGSYADVYRAWDTELQRFVAVKIPNRIGDATPQTREFALREALAAARLDHEHIVTVYEVGSLDEGLYIVSKFIDGTDLAVVIDSKRPSQAESLDLCIKILDALDHAHHAGVLHRDIKPRNVMVDKRGEPYLTDFGLARLEGSEWSISAEGVQVGSRPWMAPEHIRGDAHRADHRADIYSAGVILYELLTGQRPFTGARETLEYRIQHVAATPLRRLDETIPKDLETICLKSLEKDPARRYATAREMADDLRRFREGKPIKARPAGALRKLKLWVRRQPALAGLLVILASLLVLLAIQLQAKHRAYLASLVPVRIDTLPTGAALVFIPLDTAEHRPQAERRSRELRTPADSHLAPGDYLVVTWLPDDPQRFHEVYRHVPADLSQKPESIWSHQRWNEQDGKAVLPAIEIPPSEIFNDMARIAGSERFPLGSAALGEIATPHFRRLPGYLLDTAEVTRNDLKTKWLAARRVARGEEERGEDALAAANISFHEALARAEAKGKRLPTEAEYEYAATLGGKRPLPWTSPDAAPAEWTFGPVGVDGPDRVDLDAQRPVFGLYSNVAEWTDSWAVRYPGGRYPGVESGSLRNTRVVRGGTSTVLRGTPVREDWLRGPSFRSGAVPEYTAPGLGFRCARSLKPRLEPEDFESILAAD